MSVSMTPLSVRFGLKHILGQASSAEMGGDYDGALSSYRAAASQFQQSAQAHLAIVRVLIRLGRREEALESCLNAERLLKTNCDVQRSLFLLYCQFGRLNNAFDCLVCLNNWGEDVAEELAHIGLRFAQNGDWSRRQELNLLLENRLRSKKGCILDPYYLLSVSDDTELHRIMADSIVAAISRQWLGIREQAKKTVEDPSSRRLRIGYLGGDFNSHATSLLLTNVLECHNRRNVEVIGYDYSHEDGSAIRKRMLRAFDRVVTVGAGDPRRDALNIARDSVDILVDTKGYTRASKSELLAFRPAPVQVNFLGYVGTQGAPWIDYVIADERVAPLSEASNWAEKFAYMPSSYYPADSSSGANTPGWPYGLGCLDGRSEASANDC